MISFSRVGPAPGVRESVELRLAYRAAWLVKQDVIIRVRVKQRIEINKIDTRIRELAPVAQPLQIVAKIQPIHSLFLPAVGFGCNDPYRYRHYCRIEGQSRSRIHLFFPFDGY